MTPNPAVYHRPELAKRYADSILSTDVLSPARSGVFLAAPRRTGKSTFLREDLVPTLEAAGAVVIYVDLWSDRRRDPAELINDGVLGAIRARASAVLKLVRKTGLDKVSFAGAAFSLDRVGVGKSVTLAQALGLLSSAARQPLVLVIDEAQQALTTPAGADALFALKAARDEVNSGGYHGLRIVATGSNRDKLAQLAHGREQAFFGSTLVDFPRLGEPFVEWVLAHAFVPAKPSHAAAWRGFAAGGYRPELLLAALSSMAFGSPAADADAELADALEASARAVRDAFAQEYRQLPPLQRVVLRALARASGRFAPFAAATLEDYRAALAAYGDDEAVRVDVSSVQYALEALRDKQFIWKSSRGVYTLEDSQHVEWLGAIAESDGE